MAMSNKTIMDLTLVMCWIGVHGLAMCVRLIKSELKVCRIVTWLGGCACIGAIYLLYIVADFLIPYAQLRFESPVINGVWQFGSLIAAIAGFCAFVSFMCGQIVFFVRGWVSDDEFY